LKKKFDVEVLIGDKLKEDVFVDLCNSAKSLTDYAIEQE
jgi:hypothetical protein